MQDSSVVNYFNSNYVIAHLTVYERGDKKFLENKGAEEFLAGHGGAGKGIPFWMVLDKDGKNLADSQIKPGINCGCHLKKKKWNISYRYWKKHQKLTGPKN